MTHGLFNADRPDKAPLVLKLKFNVRGNRPESDKIGTVDQQVTMPDQLQPVFMVSLRYPQRHREREREGEQKRKAKEGMQGEKEIE